ncbi:sulfatase-like hydrolase/transferase (plasmid) [Haloterrigena salifodinae]|uniref:Sulfatase-like hydrolase/transferase n=1 Tax=Haloterrigena salifodinae TaxID=2675099 RepID=A0A8T8E691_9EURY|nr:sulfatase-like hydrolase/transferase [Haloterrigena salifodinae]QRV17395.1 sulfatase-like hydrolase/transferase [Haloterrigena salifodinae]
MAGETRDRPNVLAIVTDQQRWDTVGAYGCPVKTTANLDQIARRGTVIEQAVTPQPSCGPFRAAFQTGQYPSEVDVWRDPMALPKDEPTLAHYFKEEGYDVGFVGNWHIGGTFDAPVPQERRGGYEDFWIAADVPEFTSHPDEGHLFDTNGERVEFDQYRVDAFTEYAAKAIESLSEPFCLVVSYLEPHNQNDMWTFVAPDGYAERYSKTPYIPPDLQNRPGDWYEELPDYYGIVERIDECVGKLVESLEERGIQEETVFAYTSDHGCHFRTRPGEYKRTPHESAVRVPAILSGPGFDEGRNINRVTSTIDLPPTLLDAAGLDIPDEMHGESIMPVVSGDAPNYDSDAFIQISESQVGRAVRTDRWKYAVAAPSPTGWHGGSAEKSSEVYIERYLYDLSRDPEEQVNLVGRPDYRNVADELRERLLSYIRTVEEEDPEIEPHENGYEKF